MSPKELLYIEDALSHEKQVKTCCTDSANQLEDTELVNFTVKLGQRHNECYNRFYSLLK